MSPCRQYARPLAGRAALSAWRVPLARPGERAAMMAAAPGAPARSRRQRLRIPLLRGLFLLLVLPVC